MGDILVIAEHLRGMLAPQTGEVIGLALQAKERLGGKLSVAVIASDPAALNPQVAFEGVDEVVSVPASDDHFDAAVYEEATVRLSLDSKPRLVMTGHSANGMGFAPAVAARLGGSFASDVLGLDVASRGIFVTRGGYANKVLSRLDISHSSVTTLMVRGGSAKAPATAGEQPSIRTMTIDFAPVAAALASHEGYIDPPATDVDITKAEFILAVGRGIQDEKNIERFRALAERLGATFGCSRPIADSGWLPKAHQVGLSGKVAQNCKLYVALGISGAVQHLHGMKHVETIIAVNTDRNAPIYNVATYGAAVDLFQLTDALEQAFS